MAQVVVIQDVLALRPMEKAGYKIGYPMSYPGYGPKATKDTRKLQAKESPKSTDHKKWHAIIPTASSSAQGPLWTRAWKGSTSGDATPDWAQAGCKVASPEKMAHAKVWATRTTTQTPLRLPWRIPTDNDGNPKKYGESLWTKEQALAELDGALKILNPPAIQTKTDVAVMITDTRFKSCRSSRRTTL